MSGSGDGNGAPAPEPVQVRADCLQDLRGCLEVLRQRNAVYAGVDLLGIDLVDLQEILDAVTTASMLASPLPARITPYLTDAEFIQPIAEFNGLHNATNRL